MIEVIMTHKEKNGRIYVLLMVQIFILSSIVFIKVSLSFWQMVF